MQQMLRMLKHQSAQIERLSANDAGVGGTGGDDGFSVIGFSPPRTPLTPPRVRKDARDPPQLSYGSSTRSTVTPATAAKLASSGRRTTAVATTAVATSASARSRLQLAGRSVALARPVSQTMSLNPVEHVDDIGSSKPKII